MEQGQPAFEFNATPAEKRAVEIRTYLDEHPHIYRRFEQEALAMFKRGARRYSARTIIEYLRHHSALQADPDHTFKVNNDLAPTLARDFLARHPEVPFTFFEKRGARVVTSGEGAA